MVIHKQKHKRRNRLTKKLHELESGETIRTYIPFEENTPDYFNGHHPDTIRPRPYRNRFGQAGKERLVVYIGRDSYDNMLYLPVTASHGNKYDSIRHYEVKDKEGIDKRNIYKHSYVETTSLRALPTTQTRDFEVTGALSYEDYQNTMHRLAHTSIHFSSERDYRGYVPQDMLDNWEDIHIGKRYKKSTTSKGDTMYVSRNHAITRTDEGMVHYHKRHSKEKVQEMVEQRENVKFAKPRKSRNLSSEISSFAEHIESLSKPTHRNQTNYK